MFESIVSFTPALPASVMPLITSKIAARSVITTIQPIPYPLCLLHPTTLPLPWDQFTWYHLRWQTGFLPPLDRLSVGLITLMPLLHTSILPPSGSVTFVLLPQVQMMTISTTLMPSITSTAIRVFQWCLNVTMGVMIQLPISSLFLPLFPCTLMLLSHTATSQVFDSHY